MNKLNCPRPNYYKGKIGLNSNFSLPKLTLPKFQFSWHYSFRDILTGCRNIILFSVVVCFVFLLFYFTWYIKTIFQEDLNYARYRKEQEFNIYEYVSPIAAKVQFLEDDVNYLKAHAQITFIQSKSNNSMDLWKKALERKYKEKY